MSIVGVGVGVKRNKKQKQKTKNWSWSEKKQQKTKKQTKIKNVQHLALFLGLKKNGEHSPLFMAIAMLNNTWDLVKQSNPIPNTSGTIRGVCLAVPLVPSVAICQRYCILCFTVYHCIAKSWVASEWIWPVPQPKLHRGRRSVSFQSSVHSLTKVYKTCWLLPW